MLCLTCIEGFRMLFRVGPAFPSDPPNCMPDMEGKGLEGVGVSVSIKCHGGCGSEIVRTRAITV